MTLLLFFTLFRPHTGHLSPVEKLPCEQRKLLRWKMSTVTPNIVKQTIGRSHFKISKSESLAFLGACPLPHQMGFELEESPRHLLLCGDPALKFPTS